MSVIPVETGIQVHRTVRVPFAVTYKMDEDFFGNYLASHWPFQPSARRDPR